MQPCHVFEFPAQRAERGVHRAQPDPRGWPTRLLERGPDLFLVRSSSSPPPRVVSTCRGQPSGAAHARKIVRCSRVTQSVVMVGVRNLCLASGSTALTLGLARRRYHCKKYDDWRIGDLRELNTARIQYNVNNTMLTIQCTHIGTLEFCYNMTLCTKNVKCNDILDIDILGNPPVLLLRLPLRLTS